MAKPAVAQAIGKKGRERFEGRPQPLFSPGGRGRTRPRPAACGASAGAGSTMQNSGPATPHPPLRHLLPQGEKGPRRGLRLRGSRKSGRLQPSPALRPRKAGACPGLLGLHVRTGRCGRSASVRAAGRPLAASMLSMPQHFPAIDATPTLLAAGSYVADRALATVLFLALRDGPAAVPGRRGGRRQDRDRQGAGGQRSARQLIRLQCYEGLDVSLGGLRVELRRADDGDPPRRGRRRGQDRDAAGARTSSPSAILIKRPLLQALDPRDGRRAGAADRRARPRRRGLRGLPAGGAGRFPGDDPGARHHQGRRSRRS